MKALVYEGLNQVDIREVKDPEIQKPDDALSKSPQRPSADFFSRNITLKMGQCPVNSYISKILGMITHNQFDATDIITHRLSLSEGSHAYEIFDKKDENCIKVILKP